ncbi:hypothetical protein C8J57DRAFT_1647432 [Mycena rebaudengoi]|nr:hypothetical protein C8J57DRAFT_1647432 [Mycena rebaudengoi]
MPSKARIQDVLQFVTDTATTVRNISVAATVPFLGGAATMTLSIVETLKSSQDEAIEITEQIHHILAAVIVVYETTKINGSLPPAILSEIAKFVETLRKIDVYFKAKQGMGKLKRLLNLTESGNEVKACKAELEHTLDTFRLQTRMSAASTIFLMRKDIGQMHQELIEFVAAHLSIAQSDSSSEVSGTVSGTTGSSLSISMLPPAPHIFHGRESELREVVDLLKADSPRIAILGPGGMGKTSLAQAALHHADIASKYSERYFVPCHSSITSTDLVSAISSHIGFESAHSSQVILQYFSTTQPSLLVLDNFETTWEPISTRTQVEELLSLLAGVPHLALMITMRGAERPGKIGWTRPFPRPLIRLSDAAAHQILVDIAEDHHEPEKVQQLLDLTDNLPLAVTLMATVIGYEGCDRTLSRWKEENTHLLSNGYDQRSSLDISIMLSYSGLRMTHGAQQLLSLLSILPDGLSDADLRQSGLPIENVLACKSTLIQVALAHVDNNQCLKSLVPVREYIQRVHPPSLNLKIPLHQHLHDILCVGENLWVEPDNLPQVMKMAGNFHTVLSYAIVDDPPTQWDVTLESVIHFSRYLRVAHRGGSSLMVELWPQVVQHPGTANYGLYFSELLRLASIMLVPIDVEACIELGNHHFNGEPPSESKCQWYYRLGFFHYRRNRLGDALHYCELALSLAQGETSIMHSIILLMTSQLLQLTGVHTRALTLAQKARHICELVGDKKAWSWAIGVESWCHVAIGNLLRAEKLCREAPEQHFIEECLPEVLLTKSEYQEARVLLFKILDYRSSCRPPISDTVMCHLNLAIIAIEMGADVGVINHHLDAVRIQCTTFVVYPRGILQCDSLTANIHLRQGNTQLARQMIKKCLTSAQKDKDADITDYCLLLLADIQHGLSGYRDTERWAVISLAFGMTAMNRVTTTKALRCIGDLLAIDGDSDTALNLFMAVLDSFTAMDIHRARADCMVRMAAIFEQQGDIRKTVDLLQRARPLYERSSQEKEIIKIDTKLHDVEVLSEVHDKPLQQLEMLNVPVGDLGRTEVTELDEDAERDSDMGGEGEPERACVNSIHAT